VTQKLDLSAVKGFGRSVAEAISEGLGEPGWARERRLEAWRVYEDTPMPTRTDEAWRRTDLSPLHLESYASYLPEDPGADLPELLRSRLGQAPERVGLVAQVNSREAVVEPGEVVRVEGLVELEVDDAPGAAAPAGYRQSPMRLRTRPGARVWTTMPRPDDLRPVTRGPRPWGPLAAGRVLRLRAPDHQKRHQGFFLASSARLTTPR